MQTMLGQIPAVAQLPAASASALGPWLVCAAAALALVLLVKAVFVRRPPIEAEFVTKADFDRFASEMRSTNDAAREKFDDKLDAKFSALAEKLDLMRGELVASSTRDRKYIHERIDGLETLAARLDERTKTQG